jgi:tetrahydrodipicolinate N-succinyltransferase
MIHVTHFKKEDRSDGFATTIGDDVTIAHRVMLHGCTIEDACLIGMSATILDGLGKLVPEYLEKAKSSDYNHLLCVSMDYVEKANSAAGNN